MKLRSLRCGRDLRDRGPRNMLSYSNWSNRFPVVLYRANFLHRHRCISTARSRMPRILCVAEKPSISKAVAGHLSGGQHQTVSLSVKREPRVVAVLTISAQRNTPNKYIKNYCFDFDFGPPWGNCNVTMTAVTGHLTSTDFDSGYKNWSYPPPVTLFGAPINTFVSSVRIINTGLLLRHSAECL